MSAVADTAEGSGEMNMNTWLTRNRLSSLLNNERFMQQQVTFEDLTELNEEELEEFVNDDRLNLGALEKRKFKKAVKTLQGKQDAKQPMVIIMSEAEQNGIENINKQKQKFEIFIKNTNSFIKNTKNNAKNCESIIEQEFNKMVDKLNQRKADLRKQLQIIEDKKLKIYNNNLDKAIKMNKELINIENECQKLLINTNINTQDRKNKIISICDNMSIKGSNVLKNEMIGSVNDAFNIKFNSAQNYKFIGNICRIDGNETVPNITVTKVVRNKVDINVECKCDDEVLLYGLQCQEMKNKNDNVFMDDEDDEKKENICAYLEFKDSKYCIKNLKYESNYAIRAKAKVSKDLWTNYSKILMFETKKKVSQRLDSVILNNPNEIGIFENLLKQRLQSILKKETLTFRLLYRNSRDGNSAKAFHQKCNGYCNTIVLVHSNFNHIFGGFTTYKWQSGGGYGRADNAFLFLVRSAFNHQPRIYELLKKDNTSVYDASNCGPCFGSGFDLGLHPGDNNHYSQLGYQSRYEGRGNELCGGDTHKTNIAVHYFPVKEYEVFAVS